MPRWIGFSDVIGNGSPIFAQMRTRPGHVIPDYGPMRYYVFIQHLGYVRRPPFAVDGVSTSCISWRYPNPLQWHHNEHERISNQQSRDCLLKHLFRRISKKTSKLRVTGLCEGNSPVNSAHKGPVTRKMFPVDDVIIKISLSRQQMPMCSAGNIMSLISLMKYIKIYFTRQPCRLGASDLVMAVTWYFVGLYGYYRHAALMMTS